MRAFSKDAILHRIDNAYHPRLQRAAVATTPVNDTAPPIVHDVLQSTGQPLDETTRAFMEPRFGHDFTSVRVHNDARAAESARAVNALAWTVGNHIAFDDGRYSPGTSEGKRMLAHELTHVLQQKGEWQGQAESKPFALQIDPPESSFESQAHDAGRHVLGKQGTGPVIGTEVLRSTPGLARQPIDARHARGYGGEQGMAFTHYKSSDGWIIVEGPSGSAGHGVTQQGFDAVAYNTRTGELHLADNKSLARAGNVQSASAIDPARNLGKNVNGLIQRVQSMKDLPGKVRILGLLRQTQVAVAAGKPLPPGVKLVVSSIGGSSTGVSSGLQSRGVQHLPAPAPVTAPQQTSPPPSKQAASKAGAAGPVPKPSSAASTVAPKVGATSSPASTTAAVGPVATAPTAISPASRVSEATRAIAREAAANLKTNQRLMRVAEVLGTAAKVYGAIVTIASALESIRSAESKLAGKGFKLVKEIEQAREAESSAKDLLGNYRQRTEQLTAMQFTLFKAAAEPRAAANAYWVIEELKAPISQLDYGISQNLPRLRRARDEAVAKEKYANDVLNDPKAMAALAVAGVGTGLQAEYFELSQDWQAIRSALVGAVNALEEAQQLVGADLAFLTPWEVVMFRLSEKSALFGLPAGDIAE